MITQSLTDERYSILQGQYEARGTSCIQCPAGTYNDKEEQSGRSSCKQCLDGSVAPELGSKTCTPCQPVSDNNLKKTINSCFSVCFSQRSFSGFCCSAKFLSLLYF